MIYRKNLIYKLTTICAFVFSLTACSNVDINSNQDVQTVDKYEGFNRKVYAFNNAADKVVLKPLAKVYKAVTPEAIDKPLGNFFSNLDDVGNVVNNTLQGKFADAGNDLERVVFNSTLGLGGLVDIASSVGLPKHDEDFGQTLAKWGVKSGPYVMLPFLGPSTVRDGFGRVTVDRATNPTTFSDENVALFIADTVKTRADLFSREASLNELSNDKYSAIRDIWIQNRNFLVNDGESNADTESDLIDELEGL